MTSENAPIAIFAFRRPYHLERLLQSLLKNALMPQSPLFVFCDGPRSTDDGDAVRETRRIARKLVGGQATIQESAENRGLAHSIISGVSQLCDQFGRVIVLEDDLVLHSSCLEFLNAALTRYAQESRVFHVNGYRYPIAASQSPTFLRLTSSWGWATWDRAWKAFEADSCLLAAQLQERELTRDFDFGGTYPYFKMLKNQAAGKIDSWAIRWYASSFLRGGLSLYPSSSLVTNSGLDNSGVHCGVSSQFDVPVAASSMHWPTAVEEDMLTYSRMQVFFRSLKLPLRVRLLERLKRGLVPG